MLELLEQVKGPPFPFALTELALSALGPACHVWHEDLPISCRSPAEWPRSARLGIRILERWM